jgi:hypothetical protein
MISQMFKHFYLLIMLSKSQRTAKEKKAYKSIATCLKSLNIIIKSCMSETNVGTTPKISTIFLQNHFFTS